MTQPNYVEQVDGWFWCENTQQPVNVRQHNGYATCIPAKHRPLYLPVKNSAIRFVGVASPYSAGGTARAMQLLRSAGFVPIRLEQDIEVLERCDALIVLYRETDSHFCREAFNFMEARSRLTWLGDVESFIEHYKS